MKTYAIWNNKGGTGKTSLGFQLMCRFAHKNSAKQILAIDMCPQANLSELFLGGLQHGGSKNLLVQQGLTPRCSVGGYFQLRLPAPFAKPAFVAEDFLMRPSNNSTIPKNLTGFLRRPLAGASGKRDQYACQRADSRETPGVGVIDWLRDFITALKQPFDTIFIDANPSFSIYTQIALSSVENLILPVMADDSSRRAIQNAFSLVYGLKLPSAIYSEYAFATKLAAAGRKLPQGRHRQEPDYPVYGTGLCLCCGLVVHRR